MAHLTVADLDGLISADIKHQKIDYLCGLFFNAHMPLPANAASDNETLFNLSTSWGSTTARSTCMA